jgi:hypothetical protein
MAVRREAMSEPFIILPRSLLRSARISLPAKNLLALLADYQNRETGQCNPGIATLARDLALSVRTINRLLAELSRLGLIQIVWRQRGSHYEVAPRTRWPEILKRQIGVTENPETPNWRNVKRQIGVTDTPVSINEPDLIEPDLTTCASGDARVGGSDPPEIPRSANGCHPEWFAEWWAIYWRRVAKKPAQKAFHGAVKTPQRFRQIMEATRAQLPAMMAREPEKRPHGATWLNAERWNDEPSAPATRKAPERQLSLIERTEALWAERIARGERPI